MDGETLEGIVSGETDGMQAFMGGKLRAEGDMMLAMKLSELFPAQGEPLPTSGSTLAANESRPCGGIRRFARLENGYLRICRLYSVWPHAADIGVYPQLQVARSTDMSPPEDHNGVNRRRVLQGPVRRRRRCLDQPAIRRE